MEKNKKSQSVKSYRFDDMMPEGEITSSSNSTQKSVIFNSFIAQLTHYVSPGDFYVKNINDEELLTRITYEIQHFKQFKRLDFEYGVSVPDQDDDFISRNDYDDEDDIQTNPDLKFHVKIGDLVLAPWTSDTYSDELGELAPFNVTLRRAKIKTKRVCPEMGIYFKVFYIDYGHTKWIHWKEARKLPCLDLKLIDPIAIRCRLAGCFPTLPNNQWTYEAMSIKNFMKGDVKLKIHVDDFDELWLNEVVVEVDNPHYDDGELEPVVLNRLLFQTKQALNQKPPLIGNFRFNVKDLPQIPLKTDKVFWVRVSYIADPELIYVQLMDVVGYEGEVLDTLMKELKETRMERRISDIEYKVGELYVYRSPKGNMYRVMIEKIYSTQPIVQILSLDYGWRQICNLTNLVARLPDEPFRLASEYSTRFAQRVHLDQIEPYNPQNGWDERCRKFINRLLKPFHPYLMYVMDGNSGAVLLYEYSQTCRYDGTLEKRIICIDEELIKKNYARKCFNTDPRIYNEKVNHADLKVGDYLEEYYKIINELTNNEESPKKESEV